jgi:hypothetical protein
MSAFGNNSCRGRKFFDYSLARSKMGDYFKFCKEELPMMGDKAFRGIFGRDRRGETGSGRLRDMLPASFRFGIGNRYEPGLATGAGFRSAPRRNPSTEED